MPASWPVGLVLRLLAVGAAAALLGFLLIDTHFFATALIAAVVLALLFGELMRYATAADRDLARVIEAMGQGDFIDRPAAGSGGARAGAGGGDRRGIARPDADPADVAARARTLPPHRLAQPLRRAQRNADLAAEHPGRAGGERGQGVGRAGARSGARDHELADPGRLARADCLADGGRAGR